MKKVEYIHSPSPFARTHLFYPLIAGYDITTPNFLFERDHYPAYELLLVTKGRGSLRHGDQWIHLTAGDCLLHNMRYPHAYRAEADDPFQMYYIVFDGMDAETLWDRLFHASVVLIPSTPAESAVGYATRAILDWMREDQANNETILSILIYELLLQSSRLENHEQLMPVKPESIVKARQYIDEHYSVIRGIDEVAQAANLSLYHLIRQFKRYYGTTPKEYVLLKRINHAKRLLLLSDRSVTEIAGDSGFEAYNTFLNAFLKIEQCSPSAYRKNWRRPQ